MAEEDEEEPPEGNQDSFLPPSFSSSHTSTAGTSHPFARSFQARPPGTGEGSLCGINDMPASVTPPAGLSTGSLKTPSCSLQVPALESRGSTEAHHCSDRSCSASVNEQAQLPWKAAESSALPRADPRPCGVATGRLSSFPDNSSVSFLQTCGNQGARAFFRSLGSHSTFSESSSRLSVPFHGIPKQNLRCSGAALDGSSASALLTPSVGASSAEAAVNVLSRPPSCEGPLPTSRAPATVSDSRSVSPRLPHIRSHAPAVFTSTSYRADTSVRVPVTTLPCPGTQRQAVASCRGSPVSREASSFVTSDGRAVVSSLETSNEDVVPLKDRMCLPTSACGGARRSFSSSSPSFSGPYTSQSPQQRGGQISCTACGCYNEVCCSDGDKGDGSAPSFTSCLPRIVVHIDADCFYAQVEELLDPSISGKPVAVRQKQLIVTANLVARRKPWGVRKGIYLPEAMRKCPVLIVKNGENLDKYRRISDQILSGLKQKRFFTSYLRSNVSASSIFPVPSLPEPSSSCPNVEPDPPSSLSQNPPVLRSSPSGTQKSPRFSSRSSRSSSHVSPAGCSTPPSSRPYCHVSSPAVLAAQASDVVLEAMKSQEILVRRLGLDDFFIDVTSLVRAGAAALQRFLSPFCSPQEGRARGALMGATGSNEQATEGKGMSHDARHAFSEDIRVAKVNPSASGESCAVVTRTVAERKEGGWKAGGWRPFAGLDAVKDEGWEQPTVTGRCSGSSASPSDSRVVIRRWGNEIEKKTFPGESTFFPTGSIHQFFSRDPRGVRRPPGQSEPTSTQFSQFTVSARPPFISEQHKIMETFSDPRDNANWQGWCLSFAPYVYPEKADDPDSGKKESLSAASRQWQPMCHRCIAVWWRASKGQGGVAQQGGADSKGSGYEESQVEHSTACRGTQGVILRRGKKSRNSHQDIYTHTACTCLLPLAVATHLASAMRSFIKEQIGLTTTAGEIPFHDTSYMLRSAALHVLLCIKGGEGRLQLSTDALR